MKPFYIGLLLSPLMSYHGYRKKSLSKSGALASLLVGIASFSHPSVFFPALLLVFYTTASRMTKIHKERKKNIDEAYQEGGQRSAWQVFSCSLFAVMLLFCHLVLVYHTAQGLEEICEYDEMRWWSNVLLVAYTAFYATCTGDTYASELGTAFNTANPSDKSKWPISVLTFKKVPHGVNGAISLPGTLGSMLGGAIIGLVGFMAAGTDPESSGICLDWDLHHWVFFSTGFGFCGSMVDSFLGATLQETKVDMKSLKVKSEHNSEAINRNILASGNKILTNNQVNVISSIFTSIIAGWYIGSNI